MDVVEVISLACADLAAMHAAFGQGGSNMKFPCPKCKVHQDHLCSVAKGQQAEQRSIRMMQNLSHGVVGTCDGCRMDIVETVADKARQRPIFQPGAKGLPQRPFLFKSLPHSTTHFNQKPGQLPLFPALPVEHWSICVLHLSLRIVGMMWEHSVLKDERLNEKANKKNAGAGTLAEVIFRMLAKVGVFIKVRGAPSKDINKYFHSIAKHSFAGSDASKLLSIWRPVMDVLYPLSRREADAQAARDYESWCACWGHWESVLWPAINLETEDRLAKANTVEQERKEFVRLWKDAFGKATKHLYPHMLTCHLPQLIRDLPIDPMYLSLQSLEHRHSQRKKAAFRTNKKAPKEQGERREVVTSHVRGDGTIVPAYERNAGPSRTSQTFRLMLLQDEMQGYYETPQSQAIHHQRWLDRKNRQNQTICHRKVEQLYKASQVVDDLHGEGPDLRGCERLAR